MAEPYNVVESNEINETISTTEPVADAEYGIPPGNLNWEPYVKLPDVAGCVICKLIVCPGWIFEEDKCIVELEDNVKLKKLPWVQFIDAVPEVVVSVIGWLVNELINELQRVLYAASLDSISDLRP